jgi:hypothetical protein
MKVCLELIYLLVTEQWRKGKESREKAVVKHEGRKVICQT